MNPLNEFSEQNINYGDKKFQIQNLSHLMHQNLIFDTRDKKWFRTYNRYGWMNIYDNDQVCREYLFFTKPDLYIYNGNNYNNCSLNDSLKVIPFFVDANRRHKHSLIDLQYHIKDENGDQNPFMFFLTNNITSKMDLPGISAESNRSTVNTYGIGIDMRSHSLKSDYSFDFALSVRETAYLDIYTMVKAYDEYMRRLKVGEIDFSIGSDNSTVVGTANTYKKYIKAHTLPEQFSIYKFIVSSDGETLLFWAKATGVYFVDVPRSEFSDPPNDGFKYSLSFHANFVEDMDPMILTEFDSLTLASSNYNDFLPVYTSLGINNEPAKYARVIVAIGDKRAIRHGADNSYREYRLKWTNVRKGR